MNLYELTGEYRYLQSQIEDGDDQALESLDIVNGDLDQAFDGYAKLIRNLTAEADAMREEEKRLAAKRHSIESGVERLKQAVLEAMILTGRKKASTSIGTWGIQKNPPSVKIVDMTKVPARFLIEQAPTVDRKAMLDEYKQTGELFDGVEITQNDGLRFR